MRTAILKLLMELWLAIGLIYFFSNLKAFLTPDAFSDPRLLWGPLVTLAAALMATAAALIVVRHKAPVAKSSQKPDTLS